MATQEENNNEQDPRGVCLSDAIFGGHRCPLRRKKQRRKGKVFGLSASRL